MTVPAPGLSQHTPMADTTHFASIEHSCEPTKAYGEATLFATGPDIFVRK